MSVRFGRAWLPGVLLCLNLTGCGGSGSAPAGPPPPPVPSISLEPTNTNYTTDRSNLVFASSLTLTLHNTTTTGLYVSGAYSKAAIMRVEFGAEPTSFGLRVWYRPPSTLYNGTYNDRLTFNVCRDQACTQPISGSPVIIPITYTVTGTDPLTGATGPPPDGEAEPLNAQSRVALTHDVRDAEYSRSLDRIVMAATYPANALYVYDAATGTEQSVALAKRPTAVSISPDGLTAAVGHDGFVSIVNLTHVGQQPAPAPMLFTVSAVVYDLVLDGRGRVHVTPNAHPDLAGNLHTVDIATGTEVLSAGAPVFGQTYARLHPSGNFLFVGDPGGSPSALDKWDITEPAVRYVTTASGDGCGNMWFDESGARMYSQCGYVFETESTGNRQLAALGRLEISQSTSIGPFQIAWMDQWSARNELTMIESTVPWCKAPEYAKPCYFRLGVFDSELFTRHDMRALTPISVNGTLHVQHGLFVFYRSDGTSKYLLSRLETMFDPAAAYYVSVFN